MQAFGRRRGPGQSCKEEILRRVGEAGGTGSAERGARNSERGARNAERGARRSEEREFPLTFQAFADTDTKHGLTEVLTS